MIKALIFDLGGVIIPLDFGRGYAAMERVCGVPAAEIPKKIASTDLVRRYECGKIDTRPFVSELCALLDLRVGFDEFCELWMSIFPPGVLLDDAMIESLSRRYRLVLLSNTNPLHFDRLEQAYPILRHFERRVLSYQVGALKPSPVIYEAAVQEAGCGPGECFFTDDVLAYVEAARQAGLDAVRFESSEQLARDLRARNIGW
jgi:FMN phosphatase YigB (HAD superfamily)